VTLHREIVGSKESLEKQLGRTVSLFAFPFGKNQNISPLAAAVAGSTYSHFVSSFGGENMLSRGQKQQHLLRKNLHASVWELELELQSVFDLRRPQHAEPHLTVGGHPLVAPSS